VIITSGKEEGKETVQGSIPVRFDWKTFFLEEGD
jgi:hypothetical protein